MNALRRAFTIANFVRLGLDAGSVPNHLRLWNRYQRILSTIARSHSLDRNPCDYPKLVVEPNRYLYMSAHFGVYAHVLATLAFQSPSKKVCVLVGEQSASQAQLLGRIAARYNCEVEFIHGGFSLLKGAKRAIKNNVPLFMLIDVPWGVSTDTDGESPLLAGRLRTRSAYFRLCEALGLRPYFMLAGLNEQMTHSKVELLGELEPQLIVEKFCAAVEHSPFLWDRWFDCQKFTVAAVDGHGVIPFSANGQSYLLTLPAFKIFRADLSTSIKIRSHLRATGARANVFDTRHDLFVRQLLSSAKHAIQ